MAKKEKKEELIRVAVCVHTSETRKDDKERMWRIKDRRIKVGHNIFVSYYHTRKKKTFFKRAKVVNIIEMTPEQIKMFGVHGYAFKLREKKKKKPKNEQKKE